MINLSTIRGLCYFVRFLEQSQLKIRRLHEELETLPILLT